MALAQLIAGALAVYAVLGMAFATWFVIFAVDRFAPAARGATVAFRALIWPGSAALWPLLLLRWTGRKVAPHD